MFEHDLCLTPPHCSTIFLCHVSDTCLVIHHRNCNTRHHISWATKSAKPCATITAKLKSNWHVEEQCRDDIKAWGIAQSPKWLWRQGQLGRHPPRRWTVRTTPQQILHSRSTAQNYPVYCAVRTIPRTLLILLFYVSPQKPPIAVVGEP